MFHWKLSSSHPFLFFTFFYEKPSHPAVVPATWLFNRASPIQQTSQVAQNAEYFFLQSGIIVWLDAANESQNEAKSKSITEIPQSALRTGLAIPYSEKVSTAAYNQWYTWKESRIPALAFLSLGPRDPLYSTVQLALCTFPGFHGLMWWNL